MTDRQTETMTVLFTDLVGHSALYSRLGESEGKALILAHLRLMKQAVETYGGRQVKTEGDSMMAAFPSASGALKAAIQMQRSQARFNNADPTRSLSIRVGLNTGEPLPEGNDLFGTPVIIAARLRDRAEGGQILVSEVVRLVAGEQPGVTFTNTGSHVLKGIDDEIRVYAVGWEAEPQDEMPAASPLQGRAREMARLRQVLQDVLAGRGKAVFIAGELGVGKTRLATEVGALATDLACNFLVGHCYDMEGSPPYLPFIEALRELVRRRGPDGLIALAGRGGGILAQILPELALVDQLSLGSDPEDAEAQHNRHEALTRVFLNLAREAPLVLLLDDLQWADKLTVLLVQHMVRNIGDAPLLLLITYREHEVAAAHPLTALIADLSRQRLFERIALKGLDQEQTTELVGALVGGRPDTAVGSAIFEQTQGNPFFIEEVVTHLREEGIQLGEPVTAEADWSLPETLVSVIERRVERLGDETRRVLEAASVLGAAFPYESALAISRQDAATLAASLDSALRSGLLREERDLYRFSHGLIREVLYRSLTVSQRQALHLRAAQDLQQRRPAAGASEVAYHYRAAGPAADPALVAAACRIAGNAALEVMAWQEALLNFRAAIAAAEKVPSFDKSVLGQLHLDAARAEQGRGGHLQSIEEAGKAAELFRELDLHERLADALYTQARGLHLRVEPARALESLTAAREVLASGPDPATPESKRLQSRILEKVAQSFVLLRRYPAAEETGREAAALAEAVGDPHLVAQALFSVGLGHFAALRLAEAEAEFARCEQQSDPHRSQTGVAAASRAALALIGLGNLSGARQRALTAQQRLGRVESPYQLAWTRAPLAVVATLERNLAEARDQAEYSLREGARSDDQLLSFFVAPSLVFTALLQGDTEAAAARAEALLTEQEREGGPGPIIRGYGCLAIVRAHSGQAQESREMLLKMAERFNPRVPDIVALPMHVTLAEGGLLAGEPRLASLPFEPLLQLYRAGVHFSLHWPALLPRVLGAVAALRGDTSEAEGLLREAEQIARESGALLESALTAIELAKLALSRGDRPAATELIAAFPGRDLSLQLPLIRGRVEALGLEVDQPLDNNSKSHNIGRRSVT